MMAIISELGLSPAAALFHSLSDETRLAIVRRLAEGETLLEATGSAVVLCPNYGMDVPGGRG